MVNLVLCIITLFLLCSAQGLFYDPPDENHKSVHNLDSAEATLRFSRSILLDSEPANEVEKLQIRKRRQAGGSVIYLGPIVSELYASQHCDGIYLRWKRPPHPINDGFYTHSEFQFYNVYRSTKYFTSIQGMSPYASGREIAELRQLEKVEWLDPDPLTNDIVWYAVSMVTKDGKERKDVTPAMAMYIGAFGASGSKIPLTSNAIKGRTMHHTAIFNPDRNEYFVAWDLDSNFDGQPDRIFCLRLTPDGAIVGRSILEVTVNIRGNQGWPSVAYNPKSNEYNVVFQLSSLGLFAGKALIISQRVRPSSLTRVNNPSLLIKANDNKNGRIIPIPVTRPQIIYNRATGGYVTVAEMTSFNGRHGVVISFSDAFAKSLKLEGLFPTNLDARQCKVIYDTKRNELFIVAQLPNRAINKQGEVVPKLAYSFVVTKRNATGAALGGKMINLMGGETNLLDSSISSYYDDVKDRLMLFWNDIVDGKSVIKSSRVLLHSTQHAVEFMDAHKKELCPTPTDVKHPFVAFFPSNGGQIVAWEQSMSGKSNIGGSLVRGDTFSFVGRDQRRPFLVTNEKKKEVLVLWQEVINGQQTNLFGIRVKAVTHRCVSCSKPRTCIRDYRCVLPFKAKNPCARSNGGCSHTCLKSYSGSKCTCRDGYKLKADMKTCQARGSNSISHTYLISSLNQIWKAAEMCDGSMKYDRIPFAGRSLVALAYDTKNEMLYWSDVDNTVIRRGKLDGTAAEDFISNVAADGIAVDSGSGLVYWTDFKGKKIEVMRTNKQNRKVLASTGIDKPRAISYCKHRGSGYIYWTDWGSTSKIERIQLDSSGMNVANRRVIVNSGLGWPNGLVAACDEEKLYWADAQYDKIDVSDLTGNNRRTLAGAEPKHPYSVFIHDKSIYWTDWDGSLYRADKNTGLNEKQVIKTLQRPTGLYIIKGKVRSSKVCPDPGTPRNGERTGNDFSEDSVVVFKCKSGYNLIGDSQIRCQSNGQWTERRPFCVEMRCADPPRPIDGNRVVAGSSVGDGVVYTCNPGYKLIGSRVRMCLHGGKWSGSQPQCIALPVFSILPRNQTIEFGAVGTLRCKASTHAKITWLKDGKPFTVAETETRIFVFRTSIFIQEARYSDSGVFTCLATNEAGTINAHARLRILGKKIPDCGKPKFTTRQRIIGGRIAGAGSHPWIAMLWSNKNKKLFCGGSLIAEQWVLTAAHCVPASMWDIGDIRVKFGKTNTKRNEPHEQVKRVVKLYRHSKFNHDTFDSDVALLKLDSPVIITDYVIPICLPYDDSDFKLLKTGATTVISGWGSKNLRQVEKNKFSRKLLEVEVPVVDKVDCKEKMSHPVTDNMFCAGAGERGDACKGDSGGPVTIENTKSKKHVLIGIVSWGEGCGRKNTYGVYVKLYNFLAWINSIAK